MKSTSGSNANRGSARRLALLPIAVSTLALFNTQCGRDVPRDAIGAPTQTRTVAVAPPVARNGQKVLLVHSYHTGYPWVDAITQGVKRALAGSRVELEICYMDTKRRTSEEWKRQAGEQARRVVEEWRPDVVITADDNAQQYFAKDYAGRSTPQFVFCGVNAAPEKYGYPASNITGVLERPHYAATLELFLRMAPSAKRVAIVTDDSPTSAGAVAYFKRQQTPLEMVSCDTPSTFADWKQAIRRCQKTADVIAIFNYHTVKRAGETTSMPPKEVMAWTVANSQTPLLGFQVFTIDDGALCGYLESGVEHGFRAGRIAKELLDGKEAAEIPIVTALEGQFMLNLTAARRFGIDVPPDVMEDTEILIGSED